jgi:hypothetical protein
MSKKLEFKLVVTDGENVILSKPLSYEAVSNIISNATDSEDNSDLFHVAAKHSASSVREYVAYKDNIDDETLSGLSTDSSISVLRNLVRSRKFKEQASFDQVTQLLGLDTEIAQSIASDIESFTDVDTGKLAQLVAQHSDPAVVASLAGNYGTPKKILKTLLSHSDPHVVSEAKARLDS